MWICVQVSTPQPAVPEVTLLWEGEDSVYWRPNLQPVAAAAQPYHGLLPPPAAAPSLATVAAPLVRPKNITSGIPSVVPHSSSVSFPISALQSREANYEPATSYACSSATALPDRASASASLVKSVPSSVMPMRFQSSTTYAARPPVLTVPSARPSYDSVRQQIPTSNVSYKPPTVFQHHSSLQASVGAQNHPLPVDVLATNSQSAVASSVRTNDRQNFEGDVHLRLHNVPSNSERNDVSHPNINTSQSQSLASEILFGKKVINKFLNTIHESSQSGNGGSNLAVHNGASDRDTLTLRLREAGVITPNKSSESHNEHGSVSRASLERDGEADNRHGRRKASPDCENERLKGSSNYNPLLYSSEKKPLEERNLNRYGGEHTPFAPKAARNIVPRAVDFCQVTPTEQNRIPRHNYLNKENIPEHFDSPNHLKQTTPEFYGTARGNYDSYDQRILPYRGPSESPQFANSPDPYFCKLIDSKDQQIFQLHKFLDTILSKDENRRRNDSREWCSPQYPQLVGKEMSTQTNVSDLKRSVETRDIAINTDISWSDLLASVGRDSGSDSSDHRPSTILKNSKSFLMQKSSNTSVRFDTEGARVIESKAAVGKQQVYNVYQREAGPSRTDQNIRTSETSNAQLRNDMAISRDDYASANVSNRRHLGHQYERGNGERNRGINSTRNEVASQPLFNSKNVPHITADSGKNTASNDRYGNNKANKRGWDHRGALNENSNDDDADGDGSEDLIDCSNSGAQRYRGNGVRGHREVSLTLREVVLTTIEEDSDSRHLNSPQAGTPRLQRLVRALSFLSNILTAPVEIHC